MTEACVLLVLQQSFPEKLGDALHVINLTVQLGFPCYVILTRHPNPGTYSNAVSNKLKLLNTCTWRCSCKIWEGDSLWYMYVVKHAATCTRVHARRRGRPSALLATSFCCDIAHSSCQAIWIQFILRTRPIHGNLSCINEHTWISATDGTGGHITWAMCVCLFCRSVQQPGAHDQHHRLSQAHQLQTNAQVVSSRLLEQSKTSRIFSEQIQKFLWVETLCFALPISKGIRKQCGFTLLFFILNYAALTVLSAS